MQSTVPPPNTHTKKTQAHAQNTGAQPAPAPCYACPTPCSHSAATPQESIYDGLRGTGRTPRVLIRSMSSRLQRLSRAVVPAANYQHHHHHYQPRQRPGSGDATPQPQPAAGRPGSSGSPGGLASGLAGSSGGSGIGGQQLRPLSRNNTIKAALAAAMAMDAELQGGAPGPRMDARQAPGGAFSLGGAFLGRPPSSGAGGSGGGGERGEDTGRGGVSMAASSWGAREGQECSAAEVWWGRACSVKIKIPSTSCASHRTLPSAAHG